MPRPAEHRISKPHPSPRFKDKVRLLNFLRGPDDDGWAAQFLIDGKWLPRNPAALGTKDWDEAVERARDRYAAAAAGSPIVQARRPAATPKLPEHAFRRYAEPVIARLLAKAKEADAVAKGKGVTFYANAKVIERHLLPRWGDTPIDTITDDELNDWVEDDFRVEDVAATIARYGRQPKGEGRQTVRKQPSANTLGQLDWAFWHVWMEAVANKVVDRRTRPRVRRADLGMDNTPRAFIDRAGVEAVAALMTDEWITRPPHTPEMKFMLRAYLAVIASTGIRPGLETKRIKLGNIRFEHQQGTNVILIRVVKSQGKHKRERDVIVYEGDVFPIRALLQEQIGYRRAQGAKDTDDLFAWPDGTFPNFRTTMHDTLAEAGSLADPMTGEERVGYSFRHYFATRLIELGLSVAQIAEWLGTSSAIVEGHYNRFLNARQAHLLNGAAVRWQRQIKAMPMPVDPWDAADDLEKVG
jgi:integrase